MIQYQEEVYPAAFITARGCLWCFSKWSKPWNMYDFNMPVLICFWQNGNDPIINMHHQSLQ